MKDLISGNRFVRICAWLCLACIAFFTLGPIEFRPELIHGEANVDRFAAYLVLAILFAWAYPGRLPVVIFTIAALSVSLEGLQLLTADRHGHVRDLLFKLFGAAVGLQIGVLTLKVYAVRLKQTPVDRP